MNILFSHILSMSKYGIDSYQLNIFILKYYLFKNCQIIGHRNIYKHSIHNCVTHSWASEFLNGPFKLIFNIPLKALK